MVNRTESQNWEEIDGEVMEVGLEDSNLDDDKANLKQYHIQIKVLDGDKKVTGKTGLLHTWIRLPATTTEESVPRDSVVEKYVTILEDIHGKDVSDMKTVKEVFEFMRGKKYHFKSKVLGRAFGKNPPAEYWTPVKLLA